MPCPAAETIIDLLTNPLNSGNPEIDAAPMMQKTVVSGIDIIAAELRGRRAQRGKSDEHS